MKKENIILILIAIFVLMAGVLFGLWKKEKVQQKKDQAIDEILKKAEEEKTFVVEKASENQEEKQKEPKEFILPDMNQENWETYTDDVWGFSIKFPKEFYYRVHPQGAKSPEEGKGGQLLIISDQKEMGIQDTMPYENVHIGINSYKVDKQADIEGIIKDRHKNVDDGNRSAKVEVQKNSNKDYLVRTYLEYKKFPYDGVFHNQYLFSYVLNRYIIKNNWEYHPHGGIPFLTDKETADKQERINLIESIFSTFEFTQ